MKYYIEYPIPIRCNLQCDYCFHSEKWDLEKQGKAHEKYNEECAFTVQQYIAWRDRHLSDGTEFICDLHGGEISHPDNQTVVLNIIDTLDKEHYQLQTNGLGDTKFYYELIHRKDKIDRVGFTYHRKAISKEAEKTFTDNVKLVHSYGIKVYVKELLFPELKDEILENKRHYEALGIEFRIQDFKGYKGREPVVYTSEESAMVYPEYQHNGKHCYCRKGYKQVLIRGYDIFGGDVLACWQDPVVVGRINEDWYSGNYAVNITSNGNNVSGVQKVYRGTYPKDVWSLENEKLYGNLNKYQLKQRGMKMSAYAKGRVEELTVKFQEVQEQIKLLTEDALRIQGAIIAFEEMAKQPVEEVESEE